MEKTFEEKVGEVVKNTKQEINTYVEERLNKLEIELKEIGLEEASIVAKAMEKKKLAFERITNNLVINMEKENKAREEAYRKRINQSETTDNNIWKREYDAIWYSDLDGKVYQQSIRQKYE